eukprot:CAMPEP_0175483670 /NCGR_PEP_ID=MMETSP0095-20121207/79602_1 /TAXON_ID=311494 /ORGANISM="Alexandrium monilatum, Strain CCMP3105" /LENGTH=139 /DNA_ID=CAMNT_0016785375 /DNA_START=953 /DNA_END=1369 /DNA_ORIENTATION=-
MSEAACRPNQNDDDVVPTSTCWIRRGPTSSTAAKAGNGRSAPTSAQNSWATISRSLRAPASADAADGLLSTCRSRSARYSFAISATSSLARSRLSELILSRASGLGAPLPADAGIGLSSSESLLQQPDFAAKSCSAIVS